MQGKSIDQSKLYFGLKITRVGGDGEEIILESKNLNDVIFSRDIFYSKGENQEGVENILIFVVGPPC